MFDDFLKQPVDEVVPTGMTHIGFIGGVENGCFALARSSDAQSTSSDAQSTTTATFAKERIKDGERPSQTLRRCLEQYAGQEIESLYPVPQVWVTPTSTTYFFAGLVSQTVPQWNTKHGYMQWCCPARITALLKESKNVASRQRDLAVFQAVSEICLSPERRMMLMLRELHQMGFERLRAPSHAHNISWRYFIVPAAWTLKKHGGKFCDPRTELAPIPALRKSEPFDRRIMYAGAQKQRPFGWPDVPFATPRQLAERFIRECPDIAMVGWGPDREYVEWYKRLLDATKPYHLYNTEGDSFFSDEHIFIAMDTCFPLPPPGQTDEVEAGAFNRRFSPEPEGDNSAIRPEKFE